MKVDANHQVLQMQLALQEPTRGRNMERSNSKSELITNLAAGVSARSGLNMVHRLSVWGLVQCKTLAALGSA